MRNDLTDITVVLDRSGSMDAIKSDMEGGFNTFIEEQRKVPGECRVTLVQFDSENPYEVVYQNRHVREVTPLNLSPRGATPLRDALGRAIEDTGARLRNMPEAERPGLVIVVVITDGLENASKEWSREAVRAAVKRQENDYAWKFVYLGANQDAITEASKIGIAAHSALSYNANPESVGSSYSALSSYVSRGRVATLCAQDVNQACAFSEEDRSNAAK